jgi:outer membrane protein assembly factor BamB
MKYYLFLFLIFFTIQITYSQIVPEIMWSKIYDGPGHKSEFLYDLKADNNNNFYFAGRSDGLNGFADFFLIKYSSIGDSIFTLRYISAPNSVNEANSIAIDSEENIYAIGNASFGLTSFNAVLFKYDMNGILKWQKVFNSSEGQIVLLDPKYNPLIGINHAGTAIIGKYSTSGDSLWSTQIKDDTSHYYISNLLIDSNGNTYVVLIQTYFSGGDVPDQYTILLKLDMTGNIQWRKFIKEDSPRKLIFDNDSNLILAFNGFGNVLKLNQNGDSIWNYNSYALATDVSVDSKNNIIFTGYCGGIGYFDYMTIKLSSTGSEIWRREFNSEENLRDFASCLVIDKKDNIYISGGTNDMTSFGICYTLRYSDSGELLWQQKYKAPHSIFNDAMNIFLDDSSNVFVGGDYTDSTNGSNYFLIKIKQDIRVGVTKDNNNIPNSFRLTQNYPNPFNPNTVISYSLPSVSNVKLIVYNTLGQTVKILENGFKNAGNYSVTFNAVNLPSGIYFYKLEAGQFTQVKKMMLIK